MVTNRQAYPSGAGMLVKKLLLYYIFKVKIWRVFSGATLCLLILLHLLGVQLSMETSAPIQPLRSDVTPQDGGHKVLVVYNGYTTISCCYWIQYNWTQCG